MIKLSALTLNLLARITLTLIASSTIIACFQKVNFKGLNVIWVIWSYVICILVCIMWVIRNMSCCMWKYSVLVKIRESLLCVTNRCIKVISKLILPSVSRFKFFHHCNNRVKLICIECKSIKVSQKTILHLLTVFKLITIMLEQYCVICFGFLYFHQRNY